MLQGKICIGILFLCVNLHAQDEERRYDSPDDWQAASDNYWVCARLKGDSAKTRYADSSPVSAPSAYDVTGAVNSDQCGPGSHDHAGGWKQKDRYPEHLYLNVCGGFLEGSVNRAGGKPQLAFRHYDPEGKLLNEWVMDEQK